MKLESKLLLILICLLTTELGIAQDAPKVHSIGRSQNRLFVGGGFGRTLVHLDNRMKPHNRFELELHWSLKRQTTWIFNFEYSEANGTWGGRTFEYKNTVLLTRNVQYITTLALNIAVSKAQARSASAGVGLAFDYYHLETIVNNRTYPFYIDNRTDEIVPWGEETQTFHFLAPGLFLVAELHFPLCRSLQIYLKQQTKATYIGKNYYAHPLNSWIAFAVYGGMRVKI